MNTKGFIAAGMLVPIVIYALVVGAVIHKKAYNKAHGIERVDTLENPLPPEVAY